VTGRDAPDGTLAAFPTTRKLLCGWGRTQQSASDVMRVTEPDDVDAVMRAAVAEGRNLIARGLGRSYGDAAQCAGGVVIDGTSLDTVIDLDLDAGWVRVGAGVSLDRLMRDFLPQGWFVPVSPGTRFVTVGGAIAADVHGKNHHRDGSFCSHVTRLSLSTPSGRYEIGPERDPDLFWATAGGMGLTGIIVDATIKLLPVETSQMLVDTERARDLDDCMARMSERDHQYRYSVAWIDCLARGGKLGRAVITRSDHARLSDLRSARRTSARGTDPLGFDPRSRFGIPLTAPRGVLNPISVAAFNEFWFRRAPRSSVGRLETIAGFFHPLDGVRGWNLLYGPGGFVQYQFVVPFGAEETLRRVVDRVSRDRVASVLSVLKRFGEADPGPLSFPMAGWTLALDLPVGPHRLGPLLDDLDEMVDEAGGRVYLAKDARLRPELFEVMYPRLSEWRAVRRRVDPDGRLVSDLGRRLGIEGAATVPARRSRNEER
jgi:decaprenylphospho-beta-D-ribofuranose 2-oxidase